MEIDRKIAVTLSQDDLKGIIQDHIYRTNKLMVESENIVFQSTDIHDCDPDLEFDIAAVASDCIEIKE